MHGNTVPALAGQVTPEQHNILVRQAFSAIDAAATVEDLKKVRDQWTGLAAYARAAKDKELEADAAEIRMRAERRLGEMMQAQKERVGLNQGGRPKTGPSATRFLKSRPRSPKLGSTSIWPTAPARKQRRQRSNSKRTSPKSDQTFSKAKASTRRSSPSPGTAGRMAAMPRLKFPLDVPAEAVAMFLVELWHAASPENLRKAIENIGFNQYLAAMPEGWWPQVAERLATREVLHRRKTATITTPAEGAAMTREITPFENLVHTILYSKPVAAPRADWRRVERMLIGYFKTHRVDVLDAAGDPVLQVVRHFEAEEPITARVHLSILPAISSTRSEDEQRRQGQRDDFCAVAAAGPGRANPIRALRRALKFALRQCQLRCIAVNEEKSQEIPARAGIGAGFR